MDYFFAIEGTPIPKGSLRHVGNGRLVEQTKVKPWMSRIRSQVYDDMDGRLIDTPVGVDLEFVFSRPVSAKNRVYPHLRSVGDLDKLCRAVLDALQASKTENFGLITDDSLVVDLTARKRYTSDSWTGVKILVTELI